MNQIGLHQMSVETLVAAAIERGDEETARRELGVLLDTGDTVTLASAKRAVGRNSEESLWYFEDALEQESQSVRDDGMETALFCIPVILDDTELPIFPEEAIAKMISAMASSEESFVVLDDWIGQDSLTNLDYIGYRHLSRRLGGLARDGQKTTAAESPLVPSEIDSGHGGLTIVGVSDGLASTRNLAVRYLVGAVTRASSKEPLPGGIFDSFLDGTLDSEGIDALLASITVASGSNLQIMAPSQPLHAVARVTGFLDTLALEARLACATLMIGQKPICHYCIHVPYITIVMTGPSGQALDSVTLRGDYTSEEMVADVLFSQSVGVLCEHRLSDLPKFCPTTRH
jgi:hypothetical protein